MNLESEEDRVNLDAQQASLWVSKSKEESKKKRENEVIWLAQSKLWVPNVKSSVSGRDDDDQDKDQNSANHFLLKRDKPLWGCKIGVHYRDLDEGCTAMEREMRRGKEFIGPILQYRGWGYCSLFYFSQPISDPTQL